MKVRSLVEMVNEKRRARGHGVMCHGWFVLLGLRCDYCGALHTRPAASVEPRPLRKASGWSR